MLKKIARLFVIKTRWEAFLIIYGLALGAVERGSVYLTRYPGMGGKLLFLACTGAVFMAGGKILDCLRHEQTLAALVPEAVNDNAEPMILPDTRKQAQPEARPRNRISQTG